MADNDTDWECKPCRWFILAGALVFQQSLNIQGEVPRCPECKRLLTPCKNGADTEM